MMQVAQEKNTDGSRALPHIFAGQGAKFCAIARVRKRDCR